MADVFISYAREDRAWVSKLAAAIKAAGYSVWLDQNVVTGSEFDREIERQLVAASAIIVVWSRSASSSTWVRAEARTAIELGRYIPLTVENMSLPLPFGGYQTADFSNWRSRTDSEEFTKLLAHLAGRCNGESLKSLPQSQAVKIHAATTKRDLNISIGLLAAVLVSIAIALAPRMTMPWKIISHNEKNAVSNPSAAKKTAERTFTPKVYFDYGSDKLTFSARAMLNEVAKTVKERNLKHCNITGHIDLAEVEEFGGSDPHAFSRLSYSRAQVVLDALFHDGLGISVLSAAGTTKSVVPSGPGVREPQNRSAIIDCN